jgi:hypothetical protein
MHNCVYGKVCPWLNVYKVTPIYITSFETILETILLIVRTKIKKSEEVSGIKNNA